MSRLRPPRFRGRAIDCPPNGNREEDFIQTVKSLSFPNRGTTRKLQKHNGLARVKPPAAGSPIAHQQAKEKNVRDSDTSRNKAAGEERQLAEKPNPEKGDICIRCRVCSSPEIEMFFEIPEFPTLSSVLLSTPEAARQWPKAPIRLGFCHDCGWIGNTAFDVGLLSYGEHYENSLHHSAVFQRYADRLARHLLRRFHLYGKDVIEIGCGQGDFLHTLCRLGENRGVGFDPAFSPERARPNGRHDIRFVRDYYSPTYKDYCCDFLCCRHVLEHIDDPKAFLGNIRSALDGRPKAKLYFEVPSALYTLRDMGIWDPIYEHHSYFSRQALRRLFATSGFRVLSLRERYAGQFLCLDAALAPAGGDNSRTAARHLLRLGRDVRRFAGVYRRKVERRRSWLRAARRSGRKVVLWSAGTRAVNFLNVFREEPAIEFVVDLNPFKQGMFIPGTGQRIVSPEFLRAYRPDAVLIVNPIYRREIAAKLDALGLDSEVILA